MKSKTNWSSQQLAIFDAVESGSDSKLVIAALAGTGKTTTAVEALARTDSDSRVLACAFNKTIAVELAERLSDRAPHVEVSTLHSYGYTLAKRVMAGTLRVNASADVTRAKMYAAQVAPGHLVDRLAWPAKDLYERLVECEPNMLGEDVPGFKVNEALEKLIDRFVITVEGGATEGQLIETVGRMAMTVLDDAKSSGEISFAGMLAVPLAAKSEPRLYDKVLIDEAQDMSPAQILLAERTVKTSGQLIYVGDSNQAIYGFRGADSSVLVRIGSGANTKVLPLTVTRRCPKSHVELAQALVPAFEAAEKAPQGEIFTTSMGALTSTIKAGDFLVSRRNAPLVSTYLKLLAARIPAVIIGRADAGKTVRALANRAGAKAHSKSVNEVLKRAKYFTDIAVEQAMAREKPGTAAIAQDTYDALAALAEGVTTAGALMARIEDVLDPTAEDGKELNDSEKVRLSSVHRAKGLEADHVFVLADTLYLGNKGKFGRDPEERNIHYVAITRSKSKLTMVLGK